MVRNFVAFRKDKGYLSCMYECPVTYKGVTYKSAESAFHAQMCQFEKDKKLFIELDGQRAKELSKKKLRRVDKKQIEYDVMLEILKCKFSQNAELGHKLIREDWPIIEFNTWHDNNFGACTCAKCCKLKVRENMLGQILMRVADWLENKEQDRAAYETYKVFNEFETQKVCPLCGWQMDGELGCINIMCENSK